MLLVAGLAGCKTWQATTLSPERLIAEERPSSVRVTVSGGATLTLRDPVILNDSIVSAETPPPQGSFATPRRGVVTGDVRSLEVARFSAIKSIALVAGVAAVSIGWASVAGNSGVPGTPDPVPKALPFALSGAVHLLVGVSR